MNTEKECCPKFDPARWDGKILEWNNKPFIKGKVFTFWYMPINYGGTMSRLQKMIDNAGAKVTDGMWLSDHTSSWNMDLYLAVDKEIPGAEQATLSGRYLCKVFEGGYNSIEKWNQEYDALAKEKNVNVKRKLWWYTTCPACAKKYGKNYMVLLGEIA